MDADFLLQSRTAQELYHQHAEHLPIIDYHCHLNPKEIAEDKPFENITQVWLGGDHYKWRAMRANGVEERYITGDADPWEKFEKWAATVPMAMRNPLYHWTHLELRTAFGIETLLNPKTAREIYEECNEKLRTDPSLTPRGLMCLYGVEAVCTTDDPVDSLEYHQQIRERGFQVKVLPTWRPDKAMAIDTPATYRTYIQRLEAASGMTIESYGALLEALQRRHDFFGEQGCRLSDHGIEEFYADPFTVGEIEAIFAKVMGGEAPSEKEIRQFRTSMLLDFARMDARADWTQQFHYGPIRNCNSKLYRELGPDVGCDSIGQFPTARSLARFLDTLNSEGLLTRTILYNINPAANEMIATMLGNFQEGPTAGKIQMGAGWWFLDQIDGMRAQMNALSRQGLLSRFVGMLTDSRSFLSYPRHQYFRRTLCELVGADVEAGLVPYTGYEKERVEQMIEDISYFNASRYLHF